MTVWVYMLRCGDGSLYTGMTTRLEVRLRQHRDKTARCKFTRRADKHPLKLAAAWALQGTRGDALRLERYIKGLSRAQKLNLAADAALLQHYIEQDGFPLDCDMVPSQGESSLQEDRT